MSDPDPTTIWNRPATVLPDLRAPIAAPPPPEPGLPRRVGRAAQSAMLGLAGTIDDAVTSDVGWQDVGPVLARRASRQAAPTLGGFAGAVGGAEVGGVGGTMIGGPIGGFLGGIAGGLGGAVLGGAAIERMEHTLVPDRVQRFLGWDQTTQRADEAAHPMASAIGEIAPQALFLRPSAGLNIAGRLLGASVGGGMEAANQWEDGHPLVWSRIGTQAAMGGLLDEEWGAGRHVAESIRSIRSGGLSAALATARDTLAKTVAPVTDAVAETRDAALARLYPALPDAVRSRWLGAGTADDRLLAARARAALGDAATPEQRAALNVIDNDVLAREANPFEAGAAGDAEHGARMQSATIAALTGLPSPHFAPPVTGAGTRAALLAGTSRFSGVDGASERIIGAESRGRPDVTNPASTAVGLGQFTRPTWIRMYRRNFGGFGMNDDQVAALRGDAGLSRRMTRIAVGEYATALGRAGQPVTDGNVYLMHFLGPKAIDVLHAEAGTPMEAIVPWGFVHANPRVLRGRTAGEVRAWADRMMGGAGEIPPGSGRGEPAVPRMAATGDDDAASAAIDAELEEGSFGPIHRDAADWADGLSRLREQGGVVPDAIDHPEVGPIAVPWGEAPGSETGGYGLAKIIAKHPEVDVDRLPEMVERLPVRQRPEETGNNRYVLEDDTHRAVVAPDHFGKPGQWLVTAFERKASGGSDTSPRSPEPDGVSTGADAGRDLGAGGVDGKDGRTIRPSGLPDGSFYVHDADGEILVRKGVGYGEMPTRFRSEAAAEKAMGKLVRRSPVADEAASSGETPDGKAPNDARSLRAVDRTVAADAGRENESEPLPRLVDQTDDADAVAASRQIESLEHDVRMAVAADPEMAGRIGPDDVRAADVLAQIDEERRGIDVLKACAAPAKGDKA